MGEASVGVGNVEIEPGLLQLLETYFDRYDLDRSGNLNSPDELRQIAINMCFNHSECLRVTDVATLQSICDSTKLSNSNPMSLPVFLDWFKQELYKPPQIA